MVPYVLNTIWFACDRKRKKWFDKVNY